VEKRDEEQQKENVKDAPEKYGSIRSATSVNEDITS
jgi:hypothetical protein